jgi:predicted nucleic-acid-binding Zn-ribbon protein
MSTSKICLKCNSKLERGRLYTVTSDLTSLSKLFGYVNWEASDEHKKYSSVYAYRCEKCGFIEFYSEKRH